MKFRKNRLKDRFHYVVHRSLVRLRRILQKYSLIDSHYGDMFSDVCTKRFRKKCLIPEEEAVLRQATVEDVVLDIGAGSGRLIRLLEKKVKGIVGVDSTSNYVERLRQMHSHHERITVVEADARQLPIPSKSLDIAIMLGNTFGMFHQEIDGELLSFQPIVLRELMRVTKKEIILTVQSRDALPQLLRYYRINNIETKGLEDGILKRSGNETKENYYSQKFLESDLVEIMQVTGVKNYNIVPLNKYLWMVKISLGVLQ